MKARFGDGGLAYGRGAWGRLVDDNCVVVDSPNPNTNNPLTTTIAAPYCEVTTPFNDVKVGVPYPWPWDIQAAVNYQNLLATPSYNATMAYGNAVIAPLLGRNLGACLTATVCNQTVTVSLLVPEQQREARAQQGDLRFSKLVKVGRTRIRGRFDVYNLTNSDDVLSQTQTLAVNFRRPATVLSGRTFKFGVNIEY